MVPRRGTVLSPINGRYLNSSFSGSAGMKRGTAYGYKIEIQDRSMINDTIRKVINFQFAGKSGLLG
jgi:hypothetical protein